MAVPVIVVQGLPPAPELRTAVIAACSDALKHRSCTSPEEHGTDAPAAMVLVSWPDGTDRHVRVTLERFDLPRRPINRDTRFAEEDPIVERWRTIGLVIAALVGESDGLRDGAERESPASSDALPGAPPRAAAWLGLSALAGPGLDDGSVRLGGVFQGAFAFRTFPFFVSASAGHALRPVDDAGLDVRWTTFAVGGGATALLTSVDVGLRFRFELMLESLMASGAPGAVVAGGGRRLSPGIRGVGDIVWPASGTLGMTLGFSLWSLSGGTAIQLDRRKLGSSPWLSYAGSLGIAWSFR
jgi:hypothetical protein